MANENAVALKLLPFWISQPQVWFQQAEAQFALWNITADDTKYFYVVATLDQETASCRINFLENSPEQDRYGSIFYLFIFYFISIFILLTHRKATEALMHRVGNYPDLLPEIPRYCCPLVI